MSKIDIDAAYAFHNRQPFKRGNTIVNVTSDGRGVEMLLHGNCIAWITSESQQLWISHSGYMTKTTKARLNALNGVHIQQRDFMWFLNGIYWDGCSMYMGDGIPQVW